MQELTTIMKYYIPMAQVGLCNTTRPFRSGIWCVKLVTPGVLLATPVSLPLFKNQGRRAVMEGSMVQCI